MGLRHGGVSAGRKELSELRCRHDRTLRETLNKLEARFGEQLVSEIRTEEIREWLLSLPLAAKTRNKHRGYPSQVFNLAVDYGYTPVNPLSKIKNIRARSSEPNGQISA